ncbi:histidine kinase [Kouleothrix aurantiaca]|uniref:histidine kinase n=1 Tax=Kouleothrix aurantiaca TaxID=186479 RepID=A0A0P9D7I2_9CHLR|nr:histidine kinase [Kouleothrix aurantiaca]
MERRIGSGLRGKIFLAHLLVIIVGVLTLFAATLSIAPTLFDRLMIAMMGPDASSMGDMMAGMAETTAQAFRSAMLQALLLSAGAATLAAVAVSLFVSARIVTPIQQLLAASRRIASGHYAERASADADDELGALARQFNTMAAELEAAERRRIALIGDMAHELRTPLATIEGYTEGLLDGVVEPGDATWALLHDEVGRLRRLVQDLQELSRAEARQLPLQLRPCQVAELVDQAIRRIAPQFTEKGVTLTTDIPSDLPPVQADADRITQVLINLLGNALRYTPSEGNVRVSAERQGDSVAFHVADSGIGIAPEHLPQLFERFYRVDKARSRALGGSGIGLTIAKALVEAHDGHIWASSPGLDQGATFSFTLPIAPG